MRHGGMWKTVPAISGSDTSIVISITCNFTWAVGDAQEVGVFGHTPTPRPYPKMAVMTSLLRNNLETPNPKSPNLQCSAGEREVSI